MTGGGARLGDDGRRILVLFLVVVSVISPWRVPELQTPAGIEWEVDPPKARPPPDVLECEQIRHQQRMRGIDEGPGFDDLEEMGLDGGHLDQAQTRLLGHRHLLGLRLLLGRRLLLCSSETFPLQ